MLCECVPVGTDRGGIPTAIGDAGFIVPYGDAALLAQAIQQALDAPTGAGRKAREHIMKSFPLSRREEALRQVITAP
jgi:glycosyltransferase involved in cell wall biosynthesis